MGISKRLAATDEAIRVFASVVALLAAASRAQGSPFGRVVWLIDEFQRIQHSGKGTLREINNGLHTAFNACPTSLSLFFSFSGQPQAQLPNWFSPELRDRIGLTKVLILPPLTVAEGLEFVADVLAHSRGGAQVPTKFFPFTEDACEYVLHYIEAKGDIKHRRERANLPAGMLRSHHPEESRMPTQPRYQAWK